MINIDDLVRQRLSGEEEREPAGAWLRMQDLLEKEMPQGRPAGFYWRRSLSALSVVLLLSLLTAGGFEINAFMKRGSVPANGNLANGNAINAPAKPLAGNMAATAEAASAVSESANNNSTENTKSEQLTSENSDSKTSSDNSTSTTAAGVATTHHTNHKTITRTEKKTTSPVSTNKIAATKETGKNNTEEKAAASNNIADATPIASADESTAIVPAATVNSGFATNKKQDEIAKANIDKPEHIASKATKNNGSGGSSAGGGQVAGNTINIATPTTSEKKNSKGAVTANNKKSHGTAGNKPANTNAVAANSNNDKTSVAAAKAGNQKQNEDGEAKQADNTSGKNADKPASLAKADKKAKRAGKIAAAKTGSKKDHMLAMNTSAPRPAQTQIREDGQAKNMSALALNSGSGAGKSNSSLNAGAAQAKSTANVAGIGKSASAPAGTASSSQSKKSAKGRSAGSAAGAGIAGNNGAGQSSEPAMGERKVEKLVINLRYMKTSAYQGYYVPETVSIQKFTEQYALEANSVEKAIPNAGAPAPAGNAAKTSAPVAAGPATAANGSNIVVPGSSAPKQTTVGSLKETLSDKQPSGSSAVQSLTAAFNDIKRHVAGVQFAPGLTAGINATFFGPTSFKGFQFGVTGNFIFSDNVSVMTELKYFNRLNNNYAYDDNYSTYSPAPTGGYYRQVQTNEYSFANLQSLEMPVSARYNVGKFSFFAGGNFVYNFTINTGAEPVTPTTAPTVVSQQGNDTTAKLKSGDFKSRFGIGYLFGIAYQIAPNLTMDLRNVQTVWSSDNSSGGKIVSGQLYQGPSLQMSVIYRLGKKSK